METDIYEIMTRIAGYIDPFDGILRHGHSVYEKYPADVVLEHDASAQAHCTYRHILAEAHRRLEGDSNTRHFEIRGLNLWLLEQQNVIIRFKKTDENGLSQNYQTRQARDFDTGAELPGLPDVATRLNVGYLLDDLGVGYERSQVALPAGRSTLWCAAVVPIEDREEAGLMWQDVTREPRFRVG